MRRSILLKLVKTLIVPVILLLFWEISARTGFISYSQTSPPSKVVERLLNLCYSDVRDLLGITSPNETNQEKVFRQARILRQAYQSSKRLILGVIIGAVLGVIGGILLSHSRKADKLFSPTMQFLATIPAIVWLPFLIVLFGIGEALKMALIGIAAFFLLHIHIYQAAKSMDRDYIELSAVYEKSFLQKVRHIILPYSTPTILTGLRISLALGWIILFVTEYAVSSSAELPGLGWFILNQRQYGDMENVYAGIFLLGALGVSFDFCVVTVQRCLLMWRDTPEEAESFPKRNLSKFVPNADLSVSIKSMTYPRDNEGQLIRDFELYVPSKAFISILGASGVGKTTLLRIIAGLQSGYDGFGKFGDNTITQPSRDIQIVFQDNRLLPWKKVFHNVEFALPDSEANLTKHRVVDWIRNVQMKGDMRSWPKDLSGGEESRVAFARTFIDPPKVLLLDEPFGKLDTLTKYDLQDQLIRFLDSARITVILISHSVDDAVFLSDRIYYLSARPLTIATSWDVPVSRPRQRGDIALKELSSKIGNYINAKRQKI